MKKGGNRHRPQDSLVHSSFRATYKKRQNDDVELFASSQYYWILSDEFFQIFAGYYNELIGILSHFQYFVGYSLIIAFFRTFFYL